MKLFEFAGAETDWVAADDEASARDCLKRHYGISDDDIAASYETITEVDPTCVEMFPDDWDYDSEEDPPTAAEAMNGKDQPFVVGSTAE